MPNIYKLIVITGSRKFTDKTMMRDTLSNYPLSKFRHGDAEGADRMVDKLFPNQIERRFKPEYTGKFDRWDKNAPKRRNIKMLVTPSTLEEILGALPTLVEAFFYKTRSGGTLHTVNKARERYIEVIEHIQR